MRRPDASMDLLNDLRLGAVDPGYAEAARQPRRRRPVVLAVGLLVVGTMFGLAGATTFRTAPVAAQERNDLIARIEAAESNLDRLRADVVRLSQENAALASAASGLSPEQRDLDRRLSLETGLVPVTGPGVRHTFTDGPDTVRGSRLVDADLRMIVNGLWASGAEAVAINGHRLSSRTPIRNAGDAITVDYRSLTTPYVVEAIGDAQALESAFGDTEGGRWVAGLVEHYGIGWTSSAEQELNLGADPGLRLDRAEAKRE